MILHERKGTMQDTLSEIVEIIKANAISVYSRHGQRWRRPTVDSQTAHRPRSFVILIMRPLLRKYREIPIVAVTLENSLVGSTCAKLCNF